MKGNLIGLDIGGTKCAVIYGQFNGQDMKLVDKTIFATTHVNETIENLMRETEALMQRHDLDKTNVRAIGISCGGPLDSKNGVVMSPPNLPGWDNIPITRLVEERLGIPCAIQNDANAYALAEWKFGAGHNCRNMIFLTYGTGLGAGLIIDGKLYTGTNDNAGEAGHIRLAEFGPVGYGKSGSFEGFCSGGGIAQLARDYVSERYQMGQKVPWCPSDDIPRLTAKKVAEAAAEGHELALKIYRTSARFMGKGLSILIDLLNPEIIVLGSIYSRNETMLKPFIEEVIREEALPLAANVCSIKAAELGENVGDYAALSVAFNSLHN